MVFLILSNDSLGDGFVAKFANIKELFAFKDKVAN